MRMFPGFTSRWMMPRPEASSSAPLTWSARSNASRSGTRPIRRTMAETGSPSTYSMTRNWIASCSPARKTWTVFGCVSFAAMRASRWKRARYDSLDANSGRSSLTATVFPSETSCASNTTAMPPRPTSRTSRYSSRSDGSSRIHASRSRSCASWSERIPRSIAMRVGVLLRPCAAPACAPRGPSSCASVIIPGRARSRAAASEVSSRPREP